MTKLTNDRGALITCLEKQIAPTSLSKDHKVAKYAYDRLACQAYGGGVELNGAKFSKLH